MKKYNKYRFKNILAFWTILIWIGINSFIYAQTTTFTLGSGAVFYMSPSSTVSMNCNLNINSSATLTQNPTTLFTLTGSFYNLGTYNQNSCILNFTGGNTQSIFASPSPTFSYVSINKTAGTVQINTETKITNELRLLSDSSMLDLNQNILRIGQSGSIFYSTGSTDTTLLLAISDPKYAERFKYGRCILNSQGSGSNTFSGTLIREIGNSSPTVNTEFLFPVTTANYFTPAYIRFTGNKVTFGNNSYIGMKVIPHEHPGVEASGVSNKKYFVVSKNNVTITNRGGYMFFVYVDNEVPSTYNPGDPNILWYNPSYPDPFGYWHIDPGQANDLVDINAKIFYSEEVSEILGDWTFGNSNAASVTYYARADGNWDSASTWSKQCYDCAAPTSPPYHPNKLSDVVKIQNHNVTITDTVAPARSISVETGTNGRTSGTLTITGNYYVAGDSLIIQSGSTFKVGNDYGFSSNSASYGAVRDTVCQYSSDANYWYIGTNPLQLTGDGIPPQVNTFGVDKPSADTLLLSKDIQVKNYLILNNGKLDISDKSLNGYSSSRTFTMNNGELIIRNSYLTNYISNTFTSGTVTFFGSSNVTLPSHLSSNGVYQYNSLVIGGNRGLNSVNFPSGEIRIADIFDISSTTFSGSLTQRFVSDASSVFVFNKNGGIQNIPTQPYLPGVSGDSIYNLTYSSLKISGIGIKQLYSTSGTPTFIVANDINLTSSTFSLNGFNLEIQGNWNNLGSIFNPGNSSNGVIFRSATALITKNITSRSIIENPFNNITIAGVGIVQPFDNIYLTGNIRIVNNSNFALGSQTMTILGNWRNESTSGSGFTCGTSSVYFSGTSSQTISKIGGNATFYNLFVNNSNGVDVTGVGATTDNGVIITNLLSLPNGNLITRGRHATINNGATLQRPGANPGFIDGTLRKYVDVTSNATFEVGRLTYYTPVSLTFTGTGGSSGMLSVASNTITSTSDYPSEMPITYNGLSLSPINSGINPDKAVLRQWTIQIPTGSTFSIGLTRLYNVTINFINSADIRNLAYTGFFELRQWTGSQPWIANNLLGNPKNGAQNINNTSLTGVSTFGTFMVGEPDSYSFYSIHNGNWTDYSNWSNQGYTGTVASSTFPSGVSRVYIGNGKTITLDANRAMNSGMVTLDSNGTLMADIYVLSGSSSTFFMKLNSTLGIGHSGGITAAPTVDGNIQTTYRYYNQGYDLVKHNKSNFIYTGTTNQATGTGLPYYADSILTLTINNTGTSPNNIVSLTNNIILKDSLHVQKGVLNSTGHDIDLLGNWRIASAGSFNAGTGTESVSFTGKTSQTVTSVNNLTFRKLVINKPYSSNKVQFAPIASGSNSITIMSQLIYATGNLAYINLSPSTSSITLGSPAYGNGEWIMQIDQNASAVSRLGWGHVNGELRKYFTIGTQLRWEVGYDSIYRPVDLNLHGGSGGTNGYIGVQQVDTIQTYSNYLSDANFNYPIDRIIPKYWRLTRPYYSTFTHGTRITDVNISYKNPNDIFDGAQTLCFDLAFWRGPNNSDWQRLSPPSNAKNDGSTSAGCGDRSINNSEATYAPNGTDSSCQAYNIASTYALSDRDIGNNRYLLGDFIVAQQGPGITYYYSKNNGNWTDESTWVTGSYESTTNGGSPYGGSEKYPKRRLDAAIIGNGITVTLNANIGHGYPGSDASTTSKWHEQRIGSVVVESHNGLSGKLILGTNIIKTNLFELHDGGIIQTSTGEGFPTDLTRGNVRRQYSLGTLSRNYNYSNHNNGNYIYSGSGTITDIADNPVTNGVDGECYCNEESNNWQSGGRYINSVQVSPGSSFNSSNIIFQHLAAGYAENGFRYYADKCMTLTAGQSYTIRLTLAGTGTLSGYRIGGWIDYNFNGYFDNASELVSTTPASTSVDLTFAVPGTTPQGTTQTRFKIINAGAIGNPCTIPGGNTNGEVKDYTVNIVRANNIVSQVTGDAIPNQIGYMIVNPENSSSSVIQSKNISCSGSYTIQNGTYYPQSYSLSLQNNFINNATNLSFAQGSSGTLTFNGTSDQYIKGTTSTTFNAISINKASGSLNLNRSVAINSLLSFSKDCLFKVDSCSLYLGSSAASITSINGSFSVNRMIDFTGSSTLSRLYKQYTTTVGPKTYSYPIGINGLYNPAYISATGTYSGIPTIGVGVVASPHYMKQGTNIMQKYWPVSVSGITNLTANSLSFTYRYQDVMGDSSVYIPGKYKNGVWWEVNLGYPLGASSSPMFTINVPNYIGIDGDWTAGEPPVFFRGRNFYSIATGNWNVPDNWSNISHTGPKSSYFPGQIFASDTVYIDGYKISYNVDTATVAQMNVGGTFSGISAAGAGTFTLIPTTFTKSLTCSGTFTVKDDGLVKVEPSAFGLIDTITAGNDFINTGKLAYNCGLYLYNTDYNYATLRFAEPSTSYSTPRNSSSITGEGYWGSFGSIILDKAGGLSDTLYNNSVSFSNATLLSTGAYVFNPFNGVLYQAASATLSLSAGANTVNMQPYTGFYIPNGAILSKNSLTSNIFTTIELNGGNIYVGDGVDEDFIYNTGSNVIVNKGLFDVAGSFRRSNTNSILNLSLNSNSLIRVLNKGSLLASKIGFDISSASSSFSMTGGRVIIAQGISGADADYRVNTIYGTGISSGTIQAGDSSVVSANSIKISGTTPIYDFHSVGNNQITQITQDVFHIGNSLFIDNNNSFQLRGNTVDLKGNITSYGTFDAVTGSSTSDQRLLILSNASSTQTIYNDDSPGIEFYNLRIDKPAGIVLLASGANSNLIIRNNLEFTSTNTAIINARTNSRYVELSPSGTSNPQILRNGLGHIDGRLFRWFSSTSPQLTLFAVGSSTTTGTNHPYTPATIETIGTGGTDGLIGIMVEPFEHPQFLASSSNSLTDVQRYWNISQGTGFSLGARTFKLTTQFLYPSDWRGGNILYFSNNRYTPACPDPPSVCPATGTWTQINTPEKTTNSVTSWGNNNFGDFVIAEQTGLTFYSIANGYWTDVTCWSNGGYSNSVIAGRYPKTNTDFVKIGNGKRITVQDGTFGSIIDSVNSISIETYQNNPGELYIEGDLGYCKSASFVLNDSCTLALTNWTGISPLSAGNTGAVRSSAQRDYLIGNYKYYFSKGSQQSGNGLPQNIAALIIDNRSGISNNSVIINNSSVPLNIKDSIQIFNGTMNTSNRNLYLQGNLFLYNNAVIVPMNSEFYWTQNPLHTVLLGNTAGAEFYNMRMSKGDIYVKPSGSTFTTSQDNAHLYIDNILEFADPSATATINVRDYDRKVVMMPGGTVTRTNTGHIDGKLQKTFGSGSQNIFYEIGCGKTFTPATLIVTGTGGSSSTVFAVNYPSYSLTGNRIDSSARISRYWSLQPVGSSSIISPRTANVRFQFPASELIGLGDLVKNLPRTVIRRTSIPSETPLLSERKYGQLNWSISGDPVTVEIGNTSNNWPGLGDFYIGVKIKRTYYSRASGNWNDNNTWSFTGHTGVVADNGEYPNMDPSEIEDNVCIGGNNNHIVYLNTSSSTVTNLDIYGNAQLDLMGNKIYSSPTSSGSFSISNESLWLLNDAFLSSSIDGFPNNSLLNFNKYYVGLYSTIEYNGTATQNILPNPFSSAMDQFYGSLQISNSGTKYVISPVLIRKNLINNSSILIVNGGINALQVHENIINRGFMNNNGVIEIGQ